MENLVLDDFRVEDLLTNLIYVFLGAERNFSIVRLHPSDYVQYRVNFSRDWGDELTMACQR